MTGVQTCALPILNTTGVAVVVVPTRPLTGVMVGGVAGVTAGGGLLELPVALIAAGEPVVPVAEPAVPVPLTVVMPVGVVVAMDPGAGRGVLAVASAVLRVAAAWALASASTPLAIASADALDAVEALGSTAEAALAEADASVLGVTVAAALGADSSAPPPQAARRTAELASSCCRQAARGGR